MFSLKIAGFLVLTINCTLHLYLSVVNKGCSHERSIVRIIYRGLESLRRAEQKRLPHSSSSAGVLVIYTIRIRGRISDAPPKRCDTARKR
jgi:hypothetical protein